MASESEKVLITGASGFIGGAVLRCLIERGHAPRVLVRPGSDRRNLENLDVEVCEGDLEDPSSLSETVKGVTTLYHLAADYRIWTRDPDVLYRVNVEGTEMLMRAAQEAGVRRIIYTSSVAALGLVSEGGVADEETPVRLDEIVGHYKRSKVLAEARVRRMVENEDLPAVIVNPSAPIGPGDLKPTPTGRMVLQAARGAMPAYVDTGLNVVHVEDVAEGHLLAAEKGEVGERYILGGENLTLAEILHEIARLTGRPPPRVKLPHNLLWPLALGAEAWARTVRQEKEPFLTLDGLRMSRKRMFFSHGKAERLLGYRPRPAVQALQDAIVWFEREGLLN